MTRIHSSELKKIVEESVNFAEVLRKLGKTVNGTTTRWLRFRIREFQIDISHFVFRPERPKREILEKEVWQYPIQEVAKRRKTTAVTVRKWCDDLEIERPAKGYWAKINHEQRRLRKPYRKQS